MDEKPVGGRDQRVGGDGAKIGEQPRVEAGAEQPPERWRVRLAGGREPDGPDEARAGRRVLRQAGDRAAARQDGEAVRNSRRLNAGVPTVPTPA